jgi:hypothetical protein
MVFSGVAMVSAYEARMVNVKVHVENALDVDKELDFGPASFPEEWRVKLFLVRMSESFCQTTQQRMTGIKFRIWLEEKPGYPWLGDCLYLQWGSPVKPADALAMQHVGYGTPPIDTGIEGTLVKPTLGGNLWVGFDVPVFEGYYNATTDVKPKPSGKNVPTVVIQKSDTARWQPDGVTLGANLKFQVIDIFKP